jgi:HPt (histidine-containing phosphotransfer) domain-containing protein
MDDYLSKPIDPNRLAETILHWLGRLPGPALVAEIVQGDGQADESVGEEGSDTDRGIVPTLLHYLPTGPILPGALPFKPEILLERMGNDLEIARLVLMELIDGIPNEMAKLRETLAANDVEAAIRATHTLKGLSDSASCEPARKIAMAMEMAARANDLSSIDAALPALETEIVRFQAAARAWQSKQHPT